MNILNILKYIIIEKVAKYSDILKSVANPRSYHEAKTSQLYEKLLLFCNPFFSGLAVMFSQEDSRSTTSLMLPGKLSTPSSLPTKL